MSVPTPKHRVDSTLQELAHRSVAHLPSTSSNPHIPPPPVNKGKHSVSPADEVRLKKNQSPKTVGGQGTVKAKASSKQKKRSIQQMEKAEQFAEKLKIKDQAFEDRKAKRDRAKRTWE
ncbi:hypothetical protein [Phaffia rhodozyma]|uniref:Uncharacterized protein n=1 Tax=Phaffia rhodozyma TaxID=264483 RepID=A0A0F7SM07_PHARH|nr:hypothetical protein [Phaffia rhodozyma]